MTGVVDVMVQVARKLPPRDRRRLVEQLLKSPEFIVEERLSLAVGEPRLSKKEWASLNRLIRRQRKGGKLTRYTSLEEAKKHTARLIANAH